MNRRRALLLGALVLSAGAHLHADMRFEYTKNITTETKAWVDGPKLQAINDTKTRYQVLGWRFTTPDVAWEKIEGDSAQYYTVEQIDGKYLHEGNLSRPDLFLMPPYGSEPVPTFQVGYGGKTIDAGADGTPGDASVLLKLYDKGVLDRVQDTMLPIAPSEVASYVASFDNYYDADYRYLDTLGMRGGPSSGGFLDTWNGETQVQIAVPGDTFTLSNTPVWFSPDVAGGPNYFMALSMLQEYFNADMQFQLAIGMKETMAGLRSTPPADTPYVNGGKMDNEGDNAFGPFEVESFTYVTQAMYYPELFPKYREGLTKQSSEIEFNDNVMHVRDFTSYYAGPLSGTRLYSPYVIGAMIGSHNVFYRIYDILSNAQRICFRELLEKGNDKLLAVAALGVMYNRGITAPDAGTGITVDSVMDISVYEQYLDDPMAHEHLPIGNSDYREHLLENCAEVTGYSRKAVADLAVPIYDEFITEDILREFLFGEGGTVSTQGGGGLCAHFVVDRAALWDDAMEAFNTLSEHWNQTPKAVSFRYDWLTLMRAMKKHFQVKRALRPTSTEAATWMGNRKVEKDSCGCDGKVVDMKAPYLSLAGSLVGGGEYLAQFICQDNQDMRELMWTDDYYWESWNEGTKVSAGDSTLWQIHVEDGSLNEGDTIWVAAVDSSGNAEVKPIEVKTTGQVGTAEKGFTTNKLQVKLFQDRVSLYGLERGRGEITLYDMHGRVVELVDTDFATGAIELPLSNLASGAYVLKVSAGAKKSSVKLLIP